MKELVEILDVGALEWKPLGPPGLYSKLLSRDPETGARTALQRMVPQDGYTPPKIAHFHTTYEEIIGISGLFSFDSRRWIRPLSYAFHPPRTVHGFKSVVPEEAWFLSRVGRDLDVNLVHEPIKDDIYPLEGVTVVREPQAIAEPLVERGLHPATWGSSETPVEWCALSTDPVTGEGSAFLRIPAGWTSALAGVVPNAYLEWFVLDGELVVDGKKMSRHFYSFRPGGTFPLSISSEHGALIYLNFGEISSR